MTVPPPPENGPDIELDAYVRRNLLFGAAVLLALLGLVGIGGILYDQQLFAVTQAVYETIGLAGLGAILFLSDSVITPIPPDAILVVIAKSELHERWAPLLLAMGILSTFAGNCAWILGRRLGDVAALRRMFGRFREKNEQLVLRYGGTGVALGALTPIPFSVTCWTAGLLGLRWRTVFAATLLRIPRFFVYYVLIAYSDRLARLLF